MGQSNKCDRNWQTFCFDKLLNNGCQRTAAADSETSFSESATSIGGSFE